MKATQILWDTDGIDCSLPTEMELPEEITEEEAADYLSNQTGFLIKSFVLEPPERRDENWSIFSLAKEIREGHIKVIETANQKLHQAQKKLLEIQLSLGVFPHKLYFAERADGKKLLLNPDQALPTCVCSYRGEEFSIPAGIFSVRIPKYKILRIANALGQENEEEMFSFLYPEAYETFCKEVPNRADQQILLAIFLVDMVLEDTAGVFDSWNRYQLLDALFSGTSGLSEKRLNEDVQNCRYLREIVVQIYGWYSSIYNLDMRRKTLAFLSRLLLNAGKEVLNMSSTAKNRFLDGVSENWEFSSPDIRDIAERLRRKGFSV